MSCYGNRPPHHEYQLGSFPPQSLAISARCHDSLACFLPICFEPLLPLEEMFFSFGSQSFFLADLHIYIYILYTHAYPHDSIWSSWYHMYLYINTKINKNTDTLYISICQVNQKTPTSVRSLTVRLLGLPWNAAWPTSKAFANTSSAKDHHLEPDLVPPIFVKVRGVQF